VKAVAPAGRRLAALLAPFVAGVAVGAVVTFVLPRPSSPGSEGTVPFSGEHQAGIATPCGRLFHRTRERPSGTNPAG